MITSETPRDARFADDIRALLDVWTKIEAAVAAAYPHKSDEERYAVCCAAMNKALGLP